MAKKRPCGACPSCGETDYIGRVPAGELEFPGEQSGQPYTHVIWEQVTCRGCGQIRRVKRYENRSVEKN